MKPYRQWLPSTSYEGMGSLGGSFRSDDIEDYYVTPYELGYGPFVKFDHDFIGREALEAIADAPHRRKVTFAWNAEDVTDVFASLLVPGAEHYKYVDLPLSNYASASYDKILHRRQTRRPLDVRGLQLQRTFDAVARYRRSGHRDRLRTGARLGRGRGGSEKTTVERHRQKKIRVVVSPVPYSAVARETYAAGWRTGQAGT